jgi:hypothetical protein
MELTSDFIPGISSYYRYCIITLATIYLAIFINPATFHWALAPLFAIALILSKNVIRWFSCADIFGVKFVCALFAYYYFFISPLFYISFEGKMPSVADNLDDWRDVIGYLSLVNAVGLVIFNFVTDRVEKMPTPTSKTWTVAPYTRHRLLFAIFITGVFTIITFVKYGGISGLYNLFNDKDSELENLSLYTILCYPFPLLTYIYFVLFRKSIFNSRFKTFLVFLLMFILQVLISGASGARGNFIFVFFWAFVIYHYFIRKVERKTVLILAIPMILLIWVFSFYKSLKLEAIDRLLSGESIVSIAEDSNRQLETIFWGDMSRVSIHSYMIYKLQNSTDYEYPLGSTYLQAFYPIIPFWLWPDRPQHSGKVVAGTDLIWGKGYYTSGAEYFSSNAYGITGEAALNFGIYGFLIGFILWGFLVGLVYRYYNTLSTTSLDYRLLIYPFLLWWSFNLLLWDSDNYLGHNITKSVLLLFFLNWIFNKSATPDES